MPSSAQSSPGGASDWTQEEDRALSDFIAESMKRNIQRAEKALSGVPWDQAKIGKRTAAECQARWVYVSRNIRSHRTITEMAREWNQNVGNKKFIASCSLKNAKKHPEYPKGPLTGYMIFMMECSKKYAKKYGELPMTERSKRIAEKYQALSEEAKKVYTEKGKQDKERFEREKEEFIRNHPQFIIKDAKEASHHASVFPKAPMNPLDLFKEKLAKSSDNGTAPGTKECMKMWKELSEKKKLKYVRTAAASEEEYATKLGAYAGMHPGETLPRITPIVGKEMEALLKKAEGVPEKPPSSGRLMYLKKQLSDPEFAALDPKTRLKTLSEKWNNLSKTERAEYNLKAEKDKEKYEKQMSAMGLSAGSEKKLLTWPSVKKRGIYVFCVENVAHYMEEHADLLEPELREKMIADYNALSEEEKADYTRRAEDGKIDKTINAGLLDTSRQDDEDSEKEGKVKKLPGFDDYDDEEKSSGSDSDDFDAKKKPPPKPKPKPSPKAEKGKAKGKVEKKPAESDEDESDDESDDDFISKKPKSPPSSAFDVYIQAFKDNYREKHGKEMPDDMLANAKDKWQTLKDKKKKKYEDQWKDKTQEYKESYNKFVSGLTPKQKRVLETKDKDDWKKHSTAKKRKASSSESESSSNSGSGSDSESDSEPVVKSTNKKPVQSSPKKTVLASPKTPMPSAKSSAKKAKK